MTARSRRPVRSPRVSTRRGTRRVAMLAYPGAQILDVTGPLEVFARTSRWLKDRGRRADDAYQVEIIGLDAGPFRVSSGLRLHADHAFDDVGPGIDTLLVAGGMTAVRHSTNRDVLQWIRRQSRWVRRLASVCNGAFFLAEAGLLDGRRATTHWSDCEELARRFPRVRVEPDHIFVRDGSISTTAGVTAGMDLALALVEEDHGRDVALAVARQLVMFLQRPGGQTQFSAQLAAQLAEHEPLRDLQAHIVEHPDHDLSVPTLARRVSMSPRNFARVFTREVGMTPARYVVSIRVETARRLLEETAEDLPAIGARSGLGTAETMRRVFQRALGIAPSQYRDRFARSHDGSAGASDAARRRFS